MAVCLSLMLLMMNAAYADGAFLIHSQGWNMTDAPVEVLLSADVKTHMPFDSDRLAMLTPVTDLLNMRLVTGENEGMVSVSADDEELLKLQYRGDSVQLSSMPGITFTAAEDPISVLLGNDTSTGGLYEELGLARESESLLSDARALMSKIPEVFEEYGKKAKNTTSISGYGRAAYTMDYIIQPKNLSGAVEALMSIVPEGWLREIIGALTFSGKQSIRMHFSAEDVLLRMEYSGACGTKDDLRNVKLVYKLRHDDEVDKDYVELTSPAKKGKNKNNLTFERTLQTNKRGARTLIGQYEYSVSRNGVSSVFEGTFDLSNAYEDALDLVNGEVSFRSKLKDADKYDEIILTPDLTISGTEEQPVISGTLGITEKYANRVTEQATVKISLKRAEPLSWQESERKIDLLSLDSAALNEVRNRVAASIATAFVRPLVLKLGKDAQWFFRDMSDESVLAIIDAASNAQIQP